MVEQFIDTVFDTESIQNTLDRIAEVYPWCGDYFSDGVVCFNVDIIDLETKIYKVTYYENN